MNMIEKVTGGVPTLQTYKQSQSDNLEIRAQSIETPQTTDESKEQSQQQEPVTKEKVQNVVQGMNEFLSASSTHLKFEFHEKLKEYYVTVVDDQSNEVVKEIPAKKMLDMYAAMTDFVGLMVDKKV